MPSSLGDGRSACRTPSWPRPAPAAAVRTRARWFALSVRSVTAERGDQGAGQHRREGHGVADDSAFKKQVRARMAETRENYTIARRAVIAARDPGGRWRCGYT
jgi:hypothetical protein